MSKAPWLFAVAVAASAACPRGLTAQRDAAGGGLEPLRARADSLAREWRRAHALAEALDSLALTRTPEGRDTIRVGALRIITNPSPLPLAQAAARAWPVLDSFYGDEAQALAHRPYFIVPVDPDSTSPGESRRPPGSLAVHWDVDLRFLTDLLVTRAPLPAPDSRLERWLGGSPTPILQPRRARADVYVQLVTAYSTAARRCYLGDITSCRVAFSLLDSPDVALRWYATADERRAIVTRYLADMARGTTERAFRDCTGGDDAACTELLQTQPPEGLPQPLTTNARVTLVDLVLRLGGRDAYHRLVADSTVAIPARLATAARLPLDSVLRTWRTEILAARPPQVVLTGARLPTALVWALIFAALALGSSRWRVM